MSRVYTIPAAKPVEGTRDVSDYDIFLPEIDVEEFSVRELLALAQTEDWGYKAMRFGEVDHIAQGEDAIVGLFDTGIADHEDLDERRLRIYDHNYTTEPGVVHLHGTHTAGILAADNNNLGIKGAAPKTYLVDLKVLTQSGGSTNTLADALTEWVNLTLRPDHAHLRKIASMSLGSSIATPKLLSAIDYATSNGVVVVAASGNSGRDNIGYPARLPKVIAVGATDESGQRASFSDYGDELDVVAPGTNILSTLPGNTYGKFNGTSMACPFVAGLVARMIVKMKLETVEQVQAHLQRYAQDRGIPGFDKEYGYGFAEAPAYFLNAPSEPEPPADGEKKVPWWIWVVLAGAILLLALIIALTTGLLKLSDHIINF